MYALSTQMIYLNENVTKQRNSVEQSLMPSYTNESFHARKESNSKVFTNKNVINIGIS